MSDGKPEVIVPEEATKRGSILKGELRSSAIKISEVLAQFSKVTPQSREAKIFLYPTVEQARMIRRERSPFAFTGSFAPRDGVTEGWSSNEIWLNPTTEIYPHEMNCLTYSSGRLVDLHIGTTRQAGPNEETSKSAWFVMNGCFLLQILATQDEREIQEAKRHGFERPVYRFALSDGAIAEIQERIVQHSLGFEKEIKKRGFSITVEGCKDGETAKRDVDALLILASLASRERSVCWHWSESGNFGEQQRHWQFGIGKFPKRPDREEPLILRDPAHYSAFLSTALKKYLSSSNRELVDTAVYALLARELTLEVKIVRLLTGVQSALRFAVSQPNKKGRPEIRALYEEFERQYTIDIRDLWPLYGNGSGTSLSAIRNAAVHGEVFSESDWPALSYPAESLHWILERILLVSLGWDIKLSSVSQENLRTYCAYDWKQLQSGLNL
jgi:hypothetical protein